MWIPCFHQLQRKTVYERDSLYIPSGSSEEHNLCGEIALGFIEAMPLTEPLTLHILINLPQFRLHHRQNEERNNTYSTSFGGGFWEKIYKHLLYFF